MPIRVRLDEVMAARGIGVYDLAYRAEIPPQRIYALRANPRPERLHAPTLSRLCKALGVPLSELVVLDACQPPDATVPAA